MNKGGRLNIAILDDYQNLALRMADWSAGASREIHVEDLVAIEQRLDPLRGHLMENA